MRDAVSQQAHSTQATTSDVAPHAMHTLLEGADGQPEEFGAVHWTRDLDAALATSKQTGKPVFLLFTEVPGCSTVRGFANGALRHPLLVEAIEDEFVPVVVRNNVGGKERAILDSFGEPTWNNPVVRFLDADRHDLIPRYATGWTPQGLAESMIAALGKADRQVPAYLKRLHLELSADTDRTMFSMYCFWTGEVKLAGLPGVVSTRPGFANGHEVVEVTWDRKQTTASKLLAQAAKANAATGVIAGDAVVRKEAAKHFGDVSAPRSPMTYSEKDDKYQIRNRALGRVPMTAAQATAVNRAAVTAGLSVDEILSPRQLAFQRSGAPPPSPATGPLRPPGQ